jgi:hypothetical protein
VVTLTLVISGCGALTGAGGLPTASVGSFAAGSYPAAPETSAQASSPGSPSPLASPPPPSERTPAPLTTEVPATTPAAEVPDPPAPATPGPGCPDRTGPGDVVWVDTPVLEHDRDYHSLADWLSPQVPADWTAPADFAGGDITVCVQLLSVADPAAFPVWYTVGWGRGDGQDGYIRMGSRFEAVGQVVETRMPVKAFQRVEGGYDAGDVGDDWDWTRAFSPPNGDTWGDAPPYPLTVKVRITLHPA